jgi:hypothetical protein
LFLDPITVAKVNFLDKDYKERLVEFIEPSQLLQRYGGDLVDFTEVEGWTGEIVMHPVVVGDCSETGVVVFEEEDYVVVERHGGTVEELGPGLVPEGVAAASLSVPTYVLSGKLAEKVSPDTKSSPNLVIDIPTAPPVVSSRIFMCLGGSTRRVF